MDEIFTIEGIITLITTFKVDKFIKCKHVTDSGQIYRYELLARRRLLIIRFLNCDV